MKKIKNFLKNHHKRFLIISLIGLALILIPNAVFAQSAETKSTAQEVMEVLAVVISWVLRLFYPIMWFIITYIGELMDNSMIFGGGMEEVLLGMWRQVRNFVNIAFVIILLGIALYNIMGKTEGNYILKTIMPKFVIALVAVNFSFFACKIILDTSQMLTTAVAAIPASIYENTEIKCPKYVTTEKPDPKDPEKKIYTIKKKKDDQCYPVKSVEIYLTKTLEITGASKKTKEENNVKTEESTENIKTESAEGIEVNYDTSKPLTIENLFQISSMALYMGVNVFRITELPNIAIKAGDLSTLTIQGIFAIIFMLVYLSAFIAMFLVLIARVAVCWVMIVLSPAIALFWVLGDLLPAPEGKFNVKTMFVEHAFIPVKMVIPMTVGLMMILQEQKIISAEKGDLIGKFFQNPGQGQIVITMDALIGGIGDARLLLWNLAVVAVVWFGVFAAADKTVISESIISPLKQKLTAAAKFVSHAPAFIPIIPVITEQGQKSELSLAGASKVFNQLKYAATEGAVQARVTKAFPGLFRGSPALAAGDMADASSQKDIISVITNHNLHTGDYSKLKHKDLQMRTAEKLDYITDATTKQKALDEMKNKANWGTGDITEFKTALAQGTVPPLALQEFFKSLVSQEATATGSQTTGTDAEETKKVVKKFENVKTGQEALQQLKDNKDTSAANLGAGVGKGITNTNTDPLIETLKKTDQATLKKLAEQLTLLQSIDEGLSQDLQTNKKDGKIDFDKAKIDIAAADIRQAGDKTINRDKFDDIVEKHGLDTNQKDQLIQRIETTDELAPKPADKTMPKDLKTPSSSDKSTAESTPSETTEDKK